MATIRKIKSKRFLVEVHKHGQRISKTFDTKVQAYAWAADTEQSITKDGIVKGKTLGDALLRYRDEISPTKKSHKNEHNRLNRLLRHDQFHYMEMMARWVLLGLRKQARLQTRTDIKKESTLF